MKDKYSIGIDLGGTKTEGVLLKNNSIEVIEKIRIPTLPNRGYKSILEQTANLIQQLGKKAGGSCSVGIGIPGTIDQQTRLVKNANTRCLIGKGFQDDLEQITGQPIAMENDANCFALAEATHGAGRGYGLVLGIIMGTGMGGGIVYQGQLWSGADSIAGEWGHSTVNFKGRDCWCGKKGCLETYLSGPALERQYHLLAGEKKSLKEIYQVYKQGENQAGLVISEFLEVFGHGIANLISNFDPDLIVLGGGVSNLDILYDQGVAEVAKNIFNDQLKTPIVKNQLGDSAGVFGAAFLKG